MSMDAFIVVTPMLWLAREELSETFIRSSGPGGQNVNKVATAVELRFDARNSASLTDEVRDRVIRLAGSRATKEGEIIIRAERFRTQERNRQDAEERLVTLIKRAAEPPPPPRKPTRPTRSSVRKRLETKVRRGTVKANRQVRDVEVD
jgi:ribosome-associated protein